MLVLEHPDPPILASMEECWLASLLVVSEACRRWNCLRSALSKGSYVHVATLLPTPLHSQSVSLILRANYSVQIRVGLHFISC